MSTLSDTRDPAAFGRSRRWRSTPRRRSWFRALTLVEALTATVILALAAAAISQAIAAGQMQTVAAIEQSRAVELAEALMEEILAKPYFDPNGPSVPGPEAGELQRGQYDNDDDYHGFAESAGQLKDAAGNLYISGLQVYSRSATVSYGNVALPGVAAAIPGLTVTVVVIGSSGAQWTLSRFVGEPGS